MVLLLGQIYSRLFFLYDLITYTFLSFVITLMSRNVAKVPERFTQQQKKRILYPLYRRSRHLDRKWSVGWRRPDDGFTFLAILPYAGGILSTSLAVGYVRKIHETFVLPKSVEKEMAGNILKNAALSIIPYLGWILRRVYHVNRRNYLLLERYIMESPSKEETNSGNNSISNSSIASNLS